MAKKKKQIKRQKNYVQKIIPFIVLAIVLYTITSFALQFITGNSPDETLTRCFFLFFTVEIVNLMTIKVSKVRNKYEQKKNTDDEFINEENDIEDI